MNMREKITAGLVAARPDELEVNYQAKYNNCTIAARNMWERAVRALEQSTGFELMTAAKANAKEFYDAR